MSNKLGLIAIIGLTVSVVALSSAAVIAHSQSDNDFDLADMDWSDKPRCRFDDTAKSETRELEWTYGDQVSINLPATVRYTPGTKGSLSVTGNRELLTHVGLREGRIELDCNLCGGVEQLTITLPGSAFREFAIQGNARLTLDKISQSELNVRVSGSGRVEATGTTEDMELKLEGSGRAQMAGLAVKKLDLAIEGSAQAEALPEESAKISISGSGQVRLASSGKTLTSLDIEMEGAGNIEGSGSTNMLAVSIEGSGDAKLGKFIAKEANISIEGSGNVDIAPQDRADISISGSGDVRLHSQPKNLNSEVRGSGRVSQTAPKP